VPAPRRPVHGLEVLVPQQAQPRSIQLLKAAAECSGSTASTAHHSAHRRPRGPHPGAIYRRFKDKDALLEAVILGMLERQDERLRVGITPAAAGQIPLAVFAEQFIGGMVVSYRANAALLRAMRIFVQGKTHTPFWRKACRYETRAFEWMVELFLTHGPEISHPDPRLAVSMGLMMVVSTLFELVVMPTDLGPMKALLPKDDPSLKRELTRAFLSYVKS
jgi:AcrR family transcriptional regulator